MKILIATFFLFAWGTTTFASPSPLDIWECLKLSDPAMMKDSDVPIGFLRPVSCHLAEYSVSQMEIGINVQSKFDCLMPDGTSKTLSSGAQCLTGRRSNCQ